MERGGSGGRGEGGGVERGGDGGGGDGGEVMERGGRGGEGEGRGGEEVSACRVQPYKGRNKRTGPGYGYCPDR